MFVQHKKLEVYRFNIRYKMSEKNALVKLATRTKIVPESSELLVADVYEIVENNKPISPSANEYIFNIPRNSDTCEHFFLRSESTQYLSQFIKGYWLRNMVGVSFHLVTEPCESVLHSMYNKPEQPHIDNTCILHIPRIPILLLSGDNLLSLYIKTTKPINDLTLTHSDGFYTHTRRNLVGKQCPFYTRFSDKLHSTVILDKHNSKIPIKKCDGVISSIILKSDLPIDKIGTTLFADYDTPLFPSMYYSTMVPLQLGMNIMDNTYVIPFGAQTNRAEGDSFIIAEVNQPTNIQVICIRDNAIVYESGLCKPMFNYIRSEIES